MENDHTLFHLPHQGGLDSLILVLKELGFTVIGPRVEDGILTLGPIQGASDLPRNIKDSQEKGYYHLGASSEQGFFHYNLGPKSWKSYLFPAERILWTMGPGERAKAPPPDREKIAPYAFLGVRACELAALRIQDQILSGEGRDPYYTEHRGKALIIGVHCQTAAATCFCPSMGTGPHFVSRDYDLLLTEFPDAFLIQSGSLRGDEILTKLSVSPAPSDGEEKIQGQLAATREQIVRAIPQENIKEDIYRFLDSTYWQTIGQRCLACANCTMVCPTCFCSTVIDQKNLTLAKDQEEASRTQTWDSCFHLDFTLMHGRGVRESIGSRYRQWLSHKLATWVDQFGMSGCVGCGRCITWCPVGIDLTEEIAHLRQVTSAPDSISSSLTAGEA